MKSCVLNFYISKIEEQHVGGNSGSGQQGGASGGQQGGGQQGGASGGQQGGTTTIDDIKKAKNLVKEQTMPSMMWQKVVLDMIESHPEISSFIIDYLGS